MENKTNLLIRTKAVDSDSRRRFLRYAGFSAVTASAVLAACENAKLEPSGMGGGAGARIAADGSIDLGSGDVGILNYAYALEQLEYAFYAQVVATPYGGMSTMERQILTDIRDHEKAHRDFFRAALGGAAIPMLNANFSGVNFGDRQSVLNTARTFEDLGVSAYNGAGKLLSDGNNLSTAGKIVSVEARHAAIIRELLAAFTTYFAGDDVVTSDTGLDVVNAPATVLSAAQPFIVERITASNLPTM